MSAEKANSKYKYSSKVFVLHYFPVVTYNAAQHQLELVHISDDVLHI